MPTCLNCKKMHSNPCVCMGCKKAYYCNETCQHEHWDYHWIDCKEQPIEASPRHQLAIRACANCKEIGKMVCCGCFITQYCNKMCQSIDWKNHKETCLLLHTA